MDARCKGYATSNYIYARLYSTDKVLSGTGKLTHSHLESSTLTEVHLEDIWSYKLCQYTQSSNR